MSKLRVLVVDDSAYNRQTIAEILNSHPEIEVIGKAYDGEDALKLVDQIEPLAQRELAAIEETIGIARLVRLEIEGAEVGDRWEALGDLTVTTLAVAGAAAPKFADLAFAMSVAGPTVIPMLVSAGHTVHAEQPRLFAALVRDFLRDPVSDLHPVLA